MGKTQRKLHKETRRFFVPTIADIHIFSWWLRMVLHYPTCSDVIKHDVWEKGMWHYMEERSKGVTCPTDL